jgi:cell division transport system permease protein
MMSLFQRRSDLPFDHDATSAFLPAMMAMMVFLATLTLTGTLVLDNLLSRWNRDIKGTLTVQVIPNDASPKVNQDRVKKTVEILEETSGVVRARVLETKELVSLIKPWLGDNDLIADLPLPSLIDVTIKEDTPPDLEALSTRLKAQVPGASVDDHRVWLARVIRLADGLQILAHAVMVLVAGCGAIIVIFATRTGLAIHRQSIEILHMVGARDFYIARQYALRALWLGGQGAVIGFGVSVPVLMALGGMAKTLEGGLLAEVGLSYVHWIALFSVPVVACVLATAAAFVTVMRNLSRLT